MKSVISDETMCKNAKRITNDNYEIGELHRNKVREIKERGFNVQTGELCGRFNGVRTFIDFLEEKGGKFGGRKPTKDDSSHETGRGSGWTKYRSFEQCTQVVKETPEKFRNFKEADIKLTEYASSGNDVDYGVVGDYIDMGRVMSGEPESFGTMRNGNVVKRFANIVVNGNHASWVKSDWIDRKAQRIARVIDFLEASNVRVKLTIVYSNDNSHLELVVKQYNDRLDVNDVCVALSPDFFRRYEFYWSEHSATHDSCYGRAERLTMRSVREEDVDLNILVGSCGDADVNAKFDELEKMIEENGVEIAKDYEVLVY